MKEVQTWLAERAAKNSRAQLEAHGGFVPPPLVDPALEIALNNHWRIAPINGHSALSFYWDRVGSPSRTRSDIELLVDTYINLNWALETGEESGVVALEIDDMARYALGEWTDGDGWDQGTLRFAVGNRWFLLFQHAPGLRSKKGLEGLRLHTDGSEILIPPSRTPRGVMIRWFDPDAPFLPPPSFLLEAGRNCRQLRTSS